MDLQRHQLKPKEEDCQNVWIVHIPKMNGLLDELVNTYEVELENWAEDRPEAKYIKSYQNIKDRDGEENVIKDIKDEVKRMIYDKRNIIKTRM